MRGYQEDDGSLRPLEGEHYRTGDVATRDASGYITYVGRADDVFKSNDYRLSPFELESALIEHEAVQEAAVVPAPDPARLRSPRPMSCWRRRSAHPRNRARHLPLPQRAPRAYKRVRRLEFADLPKTISGKIRRVELRGRENEWRGGGEGARTNSASRILRS